MSRSMQPRTCAVRSADDKWLTGGDNGALLVIEARTRQKKVILEKLESGQHMQLGF